MGVYIRFIILSLTIVQSSVTTSFAVQDSIPDDLVIKLERTVCFGECPAYSVTIDSKGNVTYDGNKFVRVVDRQTDRIPLSRVAALLATIERIGFFELENSYRQPVTDNPTTFVSVVLRGRTKRIEDYLGAPKELKQFEQQIDDAARTKRWVRIDAPTIEAMAKEGRSPTVEERADLLRNALLHDDVEVVQALIAIGADPNGTYYKNNTTPLMMVQSAAATRALLDAGAIPSARNENGITALGRATRLAPEITAELLKAGAPADPPADSDGRTPLYQASCVGNAAVVRLLLAAGADPSRVRADQPMVQCARQGKEYARTRSQRPVEFKPPFEENFDGVIALLEQALAKRAPAR